MDAPVFTFHCRLSVGDAKSSSSSSSSSLWIDGAEAIAEDKTEDVDIFVNFDASNSSKTMDECRDRVYDVQITVDGKDLSELLWKPDHGGTKKRDIIEPPPPPSRTTISAAGLPSQPSFRFSSIPTEKVVVTLSHVEDVRHVYFHRYGDDVKLMSLAGILDQAYMGQ